MAALDSPARLPQAKPAKKPRPAANGNAKPAKPKAKRPPKAAAEGEGEGKKKRKKKDPNAPKGALSAFMYFSAAHREQVGSAALSLVQGSWNGSRCSVLLAFMHFSAAHCEQVGPCGVSPVQRQPPVSLQH